MARRQTKRLNAMAAVSLTAPGRHPDGEGLYLVIDPPDVKETPGAKRWAFIYRWKDDPSRPGQGRLREMGLGSFKAVGLAEARAAAQDARKLLGGTPRIDPISARRTMQEIPTFGAMADTVVAMKAKEFRNAKSVGRWKRVLEHHAAGLRELRVDRVDTVAVLNVLTPIWSTKPEIAQKGRGYMEAVLDAAKARGFRVGDNPARWRGHLDHLLPRRQALSRGHHAAMAYAEVPAFVGVLRERGALSALALEFLILTAARSGEVFGATWEEIDLGEKLWTIPPGKMKAGREHRVPLSPRAVEILEAAKLLRVSAYVFPGQKKDRPLSGMAFEMLLRRLKAGDFTTHGFRSAFRDWAGEATEFPREIAELALAHTVGDATERAYRRGDALEKRRKLMDAWAGFLGAPREKTKASNVTPMRRPAA